MMVDFLTVELPDPVGLPVNDGIVAKVKPCGEVEWSTPCHRMVEGSWSSSLAVRAIGADACSENAALVGLGAGFRRGGLCVSGNPAKFLAGHNLYGSDDPMELLGRALALALPSIWPEEAEPMELLPLIDLAEGQVSRIDLTASWLLEREADVIPFLRAMEERVWCPYRGRGVMNDVGTLYYGKTAKGKRAKDWQLKLYAKGKDIAVHKLPLPAYEVPGLLDEVNRTVRVELTLRTQELKRLGLRKLGDWNREKVAEIWRSYVDKLNFGDSALNLDTCELGELPLKARHIDALAAWKAGNDLRAGRSRPSYYRLRKELLEATGIDIATVVPKSNVIPLRRMVEATPAARPAWADRLDLALSQAA
jgi:II/X family phage/plasmid replication protein